ncbi:MAG: hypothetical protein V4812_00150 [Pseudomonadota bacterium]
MSFRALSLTASLALGLSLFVFAIPLAPRMPEAGLDPSFAFALNMAVAQGLRFGHEIIFTLGPYASTYTAMYHPETDNLMLLGGTLIGLGYLACCLLLARNRHWLLTLLIGLLLVALLSSRDAFLLSYPLVMCLALTRLPDPERYQTSRSQWLEPLIVPILAAPLGLLVITKGSFAVICAGLLLLAALYLSAKGRRLQALFLILSPLIALFLLWRHAGQRAGDLPAYFLTQAPIISGFTDAMSWPGSLGEILLWGITALAMLIGLTLCREARPEKYFLLPGLSLFLLIAFKAGFVRHDMHVTIASDGLLLTAAFLLLWRPSPGIWLSLLLLPACWIKLDQQHPHTSTHPHLDSLQDLYRGSYEALWGRLTQPESLARRYENALTALQTGYNFPKLEGSVDIYSVNQAELFASGNAWKPRPIFQSYSVYTPALARRNAEHQQSHEAADTLLFRMEPIDGRLPALEDGPSWLPLLLQYSPTRTLEQGYLQLDRRPTPQPPYYKQLDVLQATLGEPVQVPQADGLLFAQIELSPSPTGRLSSLLYKSSPLTIELVLSNGETRSFRFISGMAKEHFLLSPAVFDTQGFAQLYSSDQQERLRVLRFKIYSQHSEFQWNPAFTVTFSMAAGPKSTSVTAPAPPASIPLSRAQVDSLDRAQCEGQLDTINGKVTTPQVVGSSQLVLQGWSTVSGKEGLTPQAVFIGLIDDAGNAELYRTLPQARNDVNAYFQQPALANAGYSLSIDASRRTKEQRLEIFRLVRGRLEHCQRPSIRLSFAATRP